VSLEISSELEQPFGAENRGTRWARQLARGKQSSDYRGCGRPETEALGHFVPAVKGEAWRLGADGRERRPHGTDDKMPFTAPHLAGAGSADLYFDSGGPHSRLDSVIQGQREAY
jgi:hypothetical protein